MLAAVLPSYLQFSEVSEAIVVDDGSQDETASVASSFGRADSRVKLVRHAVNQGMTHARNTGIQHCTGDVVFFSEDDLTLAPGSLTTLYQHLQATDADIIAGRRIWMRLGETQAQALQRANRSKWPLLDRRLMEHYSHTTCSADVPCLLVGASMLVRRRVLERVRFADCYPGNAWREESDFQLSAQEHGFRVVFCPHSLSYHHDRAMAGTPGSRLRSDMIYLSWVYRNNLTFLRRHHQYLRANAPESLPFGSSRLANARYIAYRAVLLAQTELRRAWLSRGSARRV